MERHHGTMSQNYVRSIAEPPTPKIARRVLWLALAGSIACGAGAAWHYASLQLTLSHYDARAHLVVARRVIDSLTPGWRQLGSVWLPLPHLLNVFPSIWDWSYRTGAFAVAMSVVVFGAGLATLARCLVLRTGSIVAALIAPALALANPNVLYLQSTPMTEPMLFGLALMSIAAVDAWLRDPSRARAGRAGAVLVALVLTRYEGWFVAGALVTLAIALSWLRRSPGVQKVWVPPLVAIVGFFLAGRAGTGQWPMSESFFVPDPELLHQPIVVLHKMAAGFLDLAGPPLPLAGLAGLGVLLFRARLVPEVLVFATPISAAVLPFLAFYAGHPFRVRYLVPLVLAAAILSAFGIAALPRRFRVAAALLLTAGIIWGRTPFDRNAPMVIEAQWETPFRVERERVTAALVGRDDGSPILASMSSLAHYMHETSRAGFPLKRFLHEGNGDLWLEALKSPRRSVRWILIEERAEGGDVLSMLARQDATFLEGFDRVISAGGLALYERRK